MADLLTVLAVLFLLLGVPIILFGIIAVATGYLQHDAEVFVDDLLDEED